MYESLKDFDVSEDKEMSLCGGEEGGVLFWQNRGPGAPCHWRAGPPLESLNLSDFDSSLIKEKESWKHSGYIFDVKIKWYDI